MILGYILFLPYLIEYKIRCLRDWLRTKVKG
jgi:hypothetical protein